MKIKISVFNNMFAFANLSQFLLIAGIMMLSGVSYAQDASSEGPGQSSELLTIEYTRQEGVSITTKQIDYFVKLKNSTVKVENLSLSATSITCNEGSLPSSDVEFELLSLEGVVISKIDIAAGSEAKFILRTIKKDNIENSSWSCVEVIATPQGSNADAASVIIKQLNPNASNFK
ncbi:hypothetical protein [Leeuwenhoekiella sp. NPDC079379]|uniref:hypothetical protein n=1 Tax=Leeuwenhoekiella sp. NPDC079379 TaxID=3364122 RepID=UPI0037CA390F